MENRKVCIVTWFKVPNYGAFLQAYAMKNILEKKGFSVFFYDYERKCSSHNTYNIVKHPFRTIFRKIFGQKREFDERFYSEKKCMFKKEIEQNFCVATSSEEYDLCIFGSDEIFNIESGWNDFQFFSPVNSKKCISYAASFGETSVDMLHFYKLERKLSKAFSLFSGISVRDLNSMQIAEKYFEGNLAMNIDPVLYYGFEKENADMKPLNDKPYLLFYGYDTHVLNDVCKFAIKRIAQEKHLEIISCGYFHSWCDRNINCSSFEFMAYIKYAQYVVTTTFHGSVFSILLNKNFCTIPQNNTNKVHSLLSQFGLESQMLKNPANIESVLQKKHDNTEKIVRERINSEKFMETFL